MSPSQMSSSQKERDFVSEYFREVAGIMPTSKTPTELDKALLSTSIAFILRVLNRLGFRERGTPVGVLTSQYSDGVRELSWGKIDVRQLEECVKEELAREAASSK